MPPTYYVLLHVVRDSETVAVDELVVFLAVKREEKVRAAGGDEGSVGGDDVEHVLLNRGKIERSGNGGYVDVSVDDVGLGEVGTSDNVGELEGRVTVRGEQRD